MRRLDTCPILTTPFDTVDMSLEDVYGDFVTIDPDYGSIDAPDVGVLLDAGTILREQAILTLKHAGLKQDKVYMFAGNCMYNTEPRRFVAWCTARPAGDVVMLPDLDLSAKWDVYNL